MKIIAGILVSFLFLFPKQLSAQDYLYGHKKERKKVWKRWGKKKEAYNPYLDKKKKDKPSAQIDKNVKRTQKRQQRQYDKQLRRAQRGRR
ncbi:MAG: hypothetical protein KF900_09080 [Bacteroidetes bacterium]|nr:hypothetical protein [Bacteroidota bacterium]